MFYLLCKQKTAYEMRISDWSSDVCSSDLRDLLGPVDEGDGIGGQRRMVALVTAVLLADRRRTRPPVAQPLAQRSQCRAESGGIGDRKSDVYGQSASVRVGLVGPRLLKQTKLRAHTRYMPFSLRHAG